MKKLSEVTKEDAGLILYDAYGQFWLTKPKKWTLEDRTEEIGESCKFLFSKDKIWQFWFFDDKIDIEKVRDDDDEVMELVTLEDFCDVKLSCYLKAHELGYYVRQLSEILCQAEDRVAEVEKIISLSLEATDAIPDSNAKEF